MKFLLFLFFSVIMYTGCTKHSTPKEAVESMYNSLQDGDFGTFSDVTINPLLDKLSIQIIVQCPLDKKEYVGKDKLLVNKCFALKYKYLDIRNIKVDESYDDRALVSVRYLLDNKLNLDKLKVIKDNNKWYVKDYVHFENNQTK